MHWNSVNKGLMILSWSILLLQNWLRKGASAFLCSQCKVANVSLHYKVKYKLSYYITTKTLHCSNKTAPN